MKYLKLFEDINFNFDDDDFDFEEEEYGNKTFTVKELIDKLENIIPMGRKMKYLDKPVKISYLMNSGNRIVATSINGLQSWRGEYDKLTIDTGNRRLTLGELIDELKNCPKKTFYGYKGGKFKMNMDTQVWGDPAGTYQGRMIVDVVDKSDHILLKTKLHEDTRHFESNDINWDFDEEEEEPLELKYDTFEILLDMFVEDPKLLNKEENRDFLKKLTKDNPEHYQKWEYKKNITW